MEKIIRWMENNSVICYTIFDVSSQKRAERTCTEVNQATGEFTKDYEILPDGKYFIKGMNNPKGDRGAVRFDFQVGNSISNSINNMGLSVEQIRAEAYEQARKDFAWEMLDKRLTEVERKVNIIIKVVDELTDGDESNDEKATNMLQMISSAKENFEGAKDLLKDFKL